MGTLLCPSISDYAGYSVTFAIATACIYAALFYALFFLEESVVPSAVS